MRITQDTFVALLREVRDAHATDLHLKVPAPPRLRIDGKLVATQAPGLMPDDTFQAARIILQLAHKEIALATVRDEEIGFGIQGLGRFRAHIYRQRGTFGVIVHRMSFEGPSLRDLGLNAEIGDEAWDQPGLVLATGGADRLGILAAMIRHYNRSTPGHLFALERPMEYLHRDQQASIAQREIGLDTPSFAAGLEAALYSDTDAIVVTEVRDPESAELLLRMAESGRRVLAGIVGSHPSEAARWMVRRFPPHREPEVQERVREVLRLVIGYDGAQVVTLRPDEVKQV